jgi:hypothetical protein
MSVEEEGIKIGGGDKHLYELERASSRVGESIIPGARKYLLHCCH